MSVALRRAYRAFAFAPFLRASERGSEGSVKRSCNPGSVTPCMAWSLPGSKQASSRDFCRWASPAVLSHTKHYPSCGACFTGRQEKETQRHSSGPPWILGGHPRIAMKVMQPAPTSFRVFRNCAPLQRHVTLSLMCWTWWTCPARALGPTSLFGLSCRSGPAPVRAVRLGERCPGIHTCILV